MKLSVIIPIYNKAIYLGVLLDQLKNQTFNDFECLLIDDGSDDGSGEIADRYHEEDDRFQVIHIENQGVSHARNVGLDHACSQYIAFLDADDEIHSYYLQNLVSCLEESGADLGISGIRHFSTDPFKGDDIIHPTLSGKHSIYELIMTFAEVQQMNGLFGFCHAKIMRSEILKRSRFDEQLKLSEDFDFMLKVYDNAHTVFLDDHVYHYYRQAADNSSVLIRDEDIDYISQLKIRLRYARFLKKHDVYYGEQKRIAEQEIQKYIYLSLIFCHKRQRKKSFEKMYLLCRRINLCLSGNNFKQRVVFFALNHHSYGLFKRFYSGYWFGRRVKAYCRKIQ